MSKFQIILMAVFIVFIALGVVLFSTFESESDKEARIETLFWGTIDRRTFNFFLDEVRKADKKAPKIKYVQKNKENFDTEVVEAIASGRGPDVIFLGQDSILRFEDKIIIIPYESFSERQFKDTFIEEGELYLTSSGLLAFPFNVDPLVMYWNRDILRSAGIAEVPEFWDEFLTLSERITERDQSLNILKSAVALGEYRNINHAKEIISNLIIQAGNPIISRGEGGLKVLLSEKFSQILSPAESSLRFYTEFSNPTKTIYSWNRSLPNSKDSFTSGDLAIYFGFSSELQGLRDKNPNLNFDVARVPQARGLESVSTFGRMEGLAILKSSSKISPAFRAIKYLISSGVMDQFSSITGLPPVRRDLLSKSPTDAYKSVFYNSALISKGFLDPDRNASDQIFKGMIERILSGESRISTSINRANIELESLLAR